MKRIVFAAIAIAGILLLAGCPGPEEKTNTEDVSYKVTVTSTGMAGVGSLSADAKEAKEGTKITLTATLENNSCVELSASDVVISTSTISSNGGTATFTMPAADVEITADFSFVQESIKVDGVDFNINYVPSGSFIMGEENLDSYDSSPKATPLHKVTLTKDFWMGETEVTQGLWEAVWGTTWPGGDETKPKDPYGVGDDYPAYFVKWFDVVAFCNLLTKADENLANADRVYYSDESFTTPYTEDDAANKQNVYADWTKTGYRLPTEAEWEYAARYIDGTTWNNGAHVSGFTNQDQYTDEEALNAEIGKYAWWSGNNGAEGEPDYGTKEVGQKLPNALGLYDMSGNVAEWCYDLSPGFNDGKGLGYESADDVTDPTGATVTAGKSEPWFIYRGSLWTASAASLGASFRNQYYALSRQYHFGFRLCRTAE